MIHGLALLIAAIVANHSVEPSEAPLLYVCGQDAATVTIVDMTSDTVVEIVDLVALGFPENAKPHHVAVSPDGEYWFVSLIGVGAVLKFDRKNRLRGQFAFEVPGMLAIDPEGKWLYVGRSMSAVNPPQRIGVVETATMRGDEVDVIYPRPHALAVDPLGRVVYSASLGANQIGVLDRVSERVTLTSLVGPTRALVQFAVSPDGATVVATAQLTSNLLVFDTSHLPELRLISSIDVGDAPWHPAFAPDGRRVWMANKLANAVTVVDIQTGEVVEVVRGPSIEEPHGIALSPDGRKAYVSSNNLNGRYRSNKTDRTDIGILTVIDTQTFEVVGAIEVGANATGIGASTH